MQNEDTPTDHDATQAFLESLPELKEGQTFQFSCHPGVPCFNACCGDLALMLTPYDVLRLRARLALSGREFMSRHATVTPAPDTGFPLARLMMRDEMPGAPCPFVTPEGCSVYADRPGACRTYPLGRATKPGPCLEVAEQFFIVREPHCRGFETGQAWTSAQWLNDQDLKLYNRLNDRLMLFLARLKDSGARLNPKQANMIFLALYTLDAFGGFLADTGMLEKLELTQAERSQILSDETRRLEFATDWLTLALFGACEGLKRKA